MKLGIPTYTLDHDISHFKIGKSFYFDGVLCYTDYINTIENKVRILGSLYNNPERKFFPSTMVQLNKKYE